MIEFGRTEKVTREMDKLANEDHTHIATEEELNLYRSNCWIRSNFVGSDTMPRRHRVDFKEALSTLRRLKNEEDQAYYPNLVRKALPLRGGNGKLLGGIPHLRHRRDDGLDFDGAGECAETVNGLYLFVEWFSQRTWCTIYSDYIGNSQRKFAVTDGRL